MDNTEILKKAIEKATANGWENPFHTEGFQLSDKIWGAAMPAIVFRHDFAKAFWGFSSLPQSNTTYDGKISGSIDKMPIAWQLHLQTMVLEEDPIQYLAQFL